MSKIAALFLLFALLSSGLTTHTANAQEWATTENIRARLVPTADHDGINAVLEMRLTEGWHTYWKNPGDSGLPPRFDWSKSTNVNDVEVLWPFPARFDEYGLQTYGYKGDIYFPLKVDLTDPKVSTMLDLKLDIMVCNEICIPDQLLLQTTFDENHRTLNQRMVDFKTRLLPHDGDTDSMKIEGVVLGPDALVLNVFSKKGFKRADIFPVAGDIAFSAKPEIILNEDDKRKAMMKIARPADIENISEFLTGKDLSIVFVAEKEAIEKAFSF